MTIIVKLESETLTPSDFLFLAKIAGSDFDPFDP